MRGKIPAEPKMIWNEAFGNATQDGSIDLVKDASVSVAAHGQYVFVAWDNIYSYADPSASRENIHLGSYASEEDFYERLYPRYLAVFEKAKHFIMETEADPERTTVYIR